MDDDDPFIPPPASTHTRVIATALACTMGACLATASRAYASTAGIAFSGPGMGTALLDEFNSAAGLAILVLIVLSAFFSASEVAFFAIHRIRLRALEEGGGYWDRAVAAMLQRPSRLLTTILVGNMIVNVLISVMLPARVIRVIDAGVQIPAGVSLALTALLCTAILVFFGEITPKVFAVRVNEPFARLAVVPLRIVGTLLSPLCWLLLRFTDFIFTITRFNDIKAAPFITDEEFKSVVTRSEAEGVLEEDERQMIQGILEFGDARLREILVPRPDVVSISLGATVREALAVFRAHEFSRMPVQEGDLDHIAGMLYAKDLLPRASKGQLDEPVEPLVRPARFVPVTMTANTFVRDAQRTRMHLAIVVDEYGGTEGIVTLEDAVEEVVGEIQDESDPDSPSWEKIGESVYRVDGNLPLDELSELIHVAMKDDEHETVAGFLMAQTSKVLEQGDRIPHPGADFIVESMDGKRVQTLRVEVKPNLAKGPAT